jgi:hypothetical protein
MQVGLYLQRLLILGRIPRGVAQRSVSEDPHHKEGLLMIGFLLIVCTCPIVTARRSGLVGQDTQMFQHTAGFD